MKTEAFRRHAALALWLLGTAGGTTAAAGQKAQTIVGTITDETCAAASHAAMKMGDTDAECARACVIYHGAPFVLVDGGTTYQLSDQKTADALAGRKVRVVGTVDARTRTITVDSMRAEP